MSIREIFAANLRELTAERGAVARLNEATGIGRVQLNRYMKGTLPNDQNIAAIAAYFNIADEALFRNDMSEMRDRNSSVQRRIDQLKRKMLDNGRCEIGSGRYFAYLSYDASSELVVRSPLVIRHRGNHTTFRRYTDIIKKNSKKISPYHSLHDGFVRKYSESYFFLGVNLRNNKETTLLSLKKFPVGIPAFVGSALVTNENGPVCANIIIVQSDSENDCIRTFISKACVLTPESTDHEALIRSARFR